MNIEMETAEALIVLGAVTDKQLEASRLAAISTGDEHEIADLTATILARTARQITDALYPDTCGWMDNEDCDNPIEREGLCGRHLRHQARVAEILTRPAEGTVVDGVYVPTGNMAAGHEHWDDR